MSNPVTNLEIEDVLSSIRRLVAEGDKLRMTAHPTMPSATSPADGDRGTDLRSTRALSKGSTDWAEVAPVPVVKTMPEPGPDHHDGNLPQDEEPLDSLEPSSLDPGKFVLTPALRVVEPAGTTTLLWDDEVDAAAPRLPDKGAEAGADLPPASAMPADPFPLTGHDTTTALALPPEWRDEPAVAEAADTAPAIEDLSSTPELIDGSAPAPAPIEGRSRLESTIAELEAAITARPDDWEPDGSEATPVMDWATSLVEPAFLSSRQGMKTGPVAPVEDPSDAVLLTEESSWEEQLADDLSDERIDDLSEDLDRSAHGSQAGVLDDDLNAYLQEEHILDEETLRNLVIEIVRQELQGTLGERITRNVRKLVRREIYRVLSSQDFD